MAKVWRSGLNRTSVGLKPNSASSLIRSGRSPQSNQRGIETRQAIRIRETQKRVPQSNQRGIETRINKLTKWVHRRASIEPAWD